MTQIEVKDYSVDELRGAFENHMAPQVKDYGLFIGWQKLSMYPCSVRVGSIQLLTKTHNWGPVLCLCPLHAWLDRIRKIITMLLLQALY